jgi:signal transduction histidine kinase/CheY-like chemotaxis protein/PAS domain-containing protein
MDTQLAWLRKSLQSGSGLNIMPTINGMHECEVLYKLALSTGVSLDLYSTLSTFLSTSTAVLDRAAGAIIRFDNHGHLAAEVLYAVPADFLQSDDLVAISEATSANLASGQRHIPGYDWFVIPDFGVLVFAGNSDEFSEIFLTGFQDILKKLGKACHAGIAYADSRHQSQRLALATNAAKIGTWDLNLRTGELHVDARMRQLFHLPGSQSKLELDAFFDVLHEDDKNELITHVKNYLAQAVNEPTDYYFRIRTPENTVRKMAAHAVIIRENGRPARLVGVNYDITAIEVARTESLYRSQLENLLISLSIDLIKVQHEDHNQVTHRVLGQVGQFVGADRAYRFSYDFERETASNTHEWCAEGIQPEIEYLQNGPIDSIPLWVTAHRAGLPFYIKSVSELPEGHKLREILEPQGIQSLVTIPLMRENSCIGFIGFDSVRQERHWSDVDVTLLKLLADLLVNADSRFRNEALISEQHAALVNARDHAEGLAQEANKANAAKSRFVARVSHEIRTPLHAIIGLTDLVIAEPLPTQVMEFVHTIRDSGAVLLDLINDVLDFSRAESNDVVIEIQDFALDDLVMTLDRMFRPMAQKKGLAFKLDVETGISTDLRGDPLRIRQVITNLLSNAIKFTSKGHVSLAIQHKADDTNALVFSVTDTGIGIASSDIPKLFDPFFQSRNTNAFNLAGTGLGLTIANTLAGRMGGKISVHSELGHGSVFRFEIPLLSASRELKKPASLIDVAVLNPRLKRARILIADDNPINRQLMKAFLNDVACLPTLVEDGIQAVDTVSDDKHPFDIILMDCNMPGLDGFEATRKIRALPGRKGVMPIIAVTAGAMDGNKAECLAAGMDDILIKPFSKFDLLKTLDRWTNTQQPDRLTVSH